MPDGAQALLDAAHNGEGARALAAYLERWHPERPTLVIGMMRDKHVSDIVDPLLPAVSSIIATAARHTARACGARLRQCGSPRGGASNVRAEPDPALAVEHALATSRSVCVTGSIFLIGAVRDVFDAVLSCGNSSRSSQGLPLVIPPFVTMKVKALGSVTGLSWARVAPVVGFSRALFARSVRARPRRWPRRRHPPQRHWRSATRRSAGQE